MLTVVKVAFSFCIIGVFEETVSWTIDLPQVRRYFFEKSLEDRERYDRKVKDEYTSDEYPLKINPVPLPDRAVYDNINTHSLHTYFDKYRDHYADDYKYQGYMERKVHDAVRNGSAYLEGLRRAIEDYTDRLESCRRLNFTVNIIQFNPNNIIDNRPPGGLNVPNFSPNLTNIIPSLTNLTTITEMSTNFTNFMSMANNYTVFNTSDSLNNCMRADLASEHVRRLAQLAVWAASELQDQLYADKYDKHGHEHDSESEIRGYADGDGYDALLRYGVGDLSSYANDQQAGRKGHDVDRDDTLILRLAWFLDRLAHLTGYDPKPEDFVEQSTATPTTDAPAPLSLVPTLVSNEDLLRMMNCMNGTGSSVERCAFLNQTNTSNPDSLVNRGWPGLGRLSPDTTDQKPLPSENQEYTYSEQVFTDDDMPLSLPQRKTKRKRSVQGDPLQNLVQYYAKYKAWSGANLQEKDSSEMSNVNSNKEDFDRSNLIRTKRFVKKSKLHKVEKPLLHLGLLKAKLHIKKEKEVAAVKKLIHKIHPKTEVKLFKLKKSKRSIEYSKKQQPRLPVDPQGDISYYIKNKEGRSYTYNPVQAALVRAGLEQVLQTGNILVVQRYGSNYNPANRYTILEGYTRGLADV